MARRTWSANLIRTLADELEAGLSFTQATDAQSVLDSMEDIHISIGSISPTIDGIVIALGSTLSRWKADDVWPEDVETLKLIADKFDPMHEAEARW